VIVRDRVRAAAELQDAGRYAEAAEAWLTAWAAATEERKGVPILVGLRANYLSCVERLECEIKKSEYPSPGTVLRHLNPTGKVLAEAEYRGEQDVVYAGRSYSSLSAAARAASQELGMAGVGVNGWRFWGLRRRRDDSWLSRLEAQSELPAQDSPSRQVA